MLLGAQGYGRGEKPNKLGLWCFVSLMAIILDEYQLPSPANNGQVPP